MESCVTCSVFDAMVGNSSEYMNQLVSNIQGPLTALVVSMACIWVVLLGVRVVMGVMPAIEATIQFMYLVLGFGCFVGLQAGLIQTVFDAAIGLLGGLSSAVMGGGSGGGTSSMSTLLAGVENAIRNVFHMVTVFIGDSGWSFGTLVTRTIFGIALVVPYMLLLIQFLAHTSVSLFRITLACGLSPFIVALSAFPFGRQLFMQGVRTIVSAIATMICVTLVFAIVIKSVEVLNIGGDEALTPSEAANLTSGPFLATLIMGWISAAFISEAVSVAGSMAGALLGSTGAGIMTGGTVRGGKAGASAAGRLGGKAYGKFKDYRNKDKPGTISTPTENS